MFCKKSNLNDEADVEKWFVDPLIAYLQYPPEEIKLKKALRTYGIQIRSETSLYKPDYVILANKFPVLVIDAKSTSEKIEDWALKCSLYCLEINKLFQHNPVEYYVISNGISTALYKWDRQKPLIELNFEDFKKGNPKFKKFVKLIGRNNLKKISNKKHEKLMEAYFEFEPASIEKISDLFQKLHDYIWKTEKKSPSYALEELMKIIFIKIKKDTELHNKLSKNAKPRVKDVIFSGIWIQNQTENNNPINDPLFKNLVKDLEREILDKNKKRIFDTDEEIKLHPGTIMKIVENLQHIDFFKMDEDIHGRMFEIFLDATVKGKELGQFFTPRDIVKLMVEIANIQVTKTKVDSVLDPCCGSGGFLISAMNQMLKKVNDLKRISKNERKTLKDKVVDECIVGIDAGSKPAIHRTARMNMYLHGDGGSSIYFADSLDKKIGLVSSSNLELEAEVAEIRNILVEDEKKFEVILSNPPFAMSYSRDTTEQSDILDQYRISSINTKSKSVLSSILFLERYIDLVSENGKIFAIIDDSILSGESYKLIRNEIRKNFIIIGIISLPGDAFKRAHSRVSTSIIILRLKKTIGEEPEKQRSVFMETSIYLGLTKITAKRIGINEKELVKGKKQEMERIIKNYKKFLDGKKGKLVVPAKNIQNRLDVKYCLKNNSRRKKYWLTQKLEVTDLNTELSEAKSRIVKVNESKNYRLLKVNYDGEVLEAESKIGDESSYTHLYKVRTWDILYSNMGVGRGACAIVPTYFSGNYVSSEYTILTAKSKEEAFFYSNLLRTKEILGDVLSSTTGMNRGRIKWAEMKTIEIPCYSEKHHKMKDTVKSLEDLWKSHSKYNDSKKLQIKKLNSELKLDNADSRKRWLAYKPPE